MREFRVYGIPKPGGSKKAFVVRGRAIITDACKDNKQWRDSVIAAFVDVHGKALVYDCPLNVVICFIMPRPKGHYGKRGLRSSAPIYPTTKPDLLKLARSTEDALTSFAWRDDCLIVDEHIFKVYESDKEKPGAIIQIKEV
jgi:Holliday junction resolvase RusA-like endonuclease